RGYGRAHDQIPPNVPIGRTEGLRPNEERPDCFSLPAQADVAHDADNLPSVILSSEVLANRIFVWKILPRQCFVDYGDARGRGDVALLEEASAGEWDSHCAKIMR